MHVEVTKQQVCSHRQAVCLATAVDCGNRKNDGNKEKEEDNSEFHKSLGYEILCDKVTKQSKREI